MRLTGISIQMLEEIIDLWLALARHEVISCPHTAFIATKTAQEVSHRYLDDLGIKFNQLDTHNERIMARLYEGLRYNDELIYDILEHHILTKIHQEPYILSSNAINHADIYRSKQRELWF